MGFGKSASPHQNLLGATVPEVSSYYPLVLDGKLAHRLLAFEAAIMNIAAAGRVLTKN